jgi:hypothetical protein
MLKIAADHYPDVRVLATGSSTLAALRGPRRAYVASPRQVIA